MKSEQDCPFTVVCDETNNSEEDIRNNVLRATILGPLEAFIRAFLASGDIKMGISDEGKIVILDEGESDV